MPFVSKAQRRKFYALKNEGKMDQATIDEWEADTSKNIPNRLEKKSMSSFLKGFEKKAYGKAYASEGGAFLNWNEGGGLMPMNDQDTATAEGVGLKTLPNDAPGASCATCKFFRVTGGKEGLGLCQNPEVRQDVTERMLCDLWEHPGTMMAVEPPPEPTPGDAAVSPEEEAMGDIPPQEGAPEAGTPQEGAPQEGEQPPAEAPPAEAPPAEAGAPSMTDEVGKQMPDLKEKSEKKPAKKKSEDKDKDKGDSKDKQTININVGSEKKASLTDLVRNFI